MMTTAKQLIDTAQNQARVAAYLAQCRVVGLNENESLMPPTAEETTELIKFLQAAGSNPLVIGSVGVLSHLRSVDPNLGYRPTVDLDLWVTRLPATLPPGWSRDPEAIGVPCWISPSGGRVDFLMPSQALPGSKTPRALEPDESTAGTDFPVASLTSILRLKLNSVREKDLADAIALVRAHQRVPSREELGGLNTTQRENYELLGQWFKYRPHGNYGE